MNKHLKIGKYKHFKGGEYKVIGESEHTESKEKLVVYQDLKSHKLWTRPLASFNEKAEVDGKMQERFEYMGELKDEFEEKYLRSLAESQNVLKQTAKEKEEFRQFAQIRFIEQVLPVYDNLKISMDHVGDEKSPWVQGVEYVVKQFGDVLKQFGVIEIETLGHKFNHSEMEAVSEEETLDKKAVGHVAKQVTPGYKLSNRLIRAARVVVYKLKDETQTSSNVNE